MDFYYVMVDFYSDILDTENFEEVLVPYLTLDEAINAIEETMNIYEKYYNSDEYNSFWIPDTKTIIGFITIKNNLKTMAFRFEVVQGNLGIIKTK